MSVTNIEEAIYSVLSSTPIVTDQINTRIYPVQAKQNPTYPFVVYSLVSDRSLQWLSGPGGMYWSRFQFDCYGRSYRQAKNLAYSLRDVWDGYSAIVGSVDICRVSYVTMVDDFAPVTGLYLVTVDFRIQYARNPTASPLILISINQPAPDDKDVFTNKENSVTNLVVHPVKPAGVVDLPDANSVIIDVFNFLIHKHYDGSQAIIEEHAVIGLVAERLNTPADTVICDQLHRVETIFSSDWTVTYVEADDVSVPVSHFVFQS